MHTPKKSTNISSAIRNSTISGNTNPFNEGGGISNFGTLTVTGSTVERHDTIGGACSKESNALRYGFHTMAQHACVENFLQANARHGRGKRDMVSNINWFMNVPVEADGALGIVDGISAPGLVHPGDQRQRDRRQRADVHRRAGRRTPRRGRVRRA